MQRTSILGRLIAGLVLATALLAALVPAAGAEEGGGTVEIHSRLCPPGYAGGSHYDDCHGTPLPGVTFYASLAGSDAVPSAIAGEDGNAYLVGLSGAVEIDEDVAGLYAEAPAYCSMDGVEVPFERTALGGIALTVDPGAQIVCDWYHVPPAEAEPEPEPEPVDEALPASLTIYTVSCPPGYTGEHLYADCYGTPRNGVAYRLVRSDTDPGYVALGDDFGVITFALEDGLPATITVLEEEVEKGNQFHAVCTRNGGQEVPYWFGNGNVRAVDVAPGDDVRCDWFDLPAAVVAPGATLIVQVNACPPNYEGANHAVDCAGNPVAGQPFFVHLGGTGYDGTRLDGVTDAEGFVDFVVDGAALPTDLWLVEDLSAEENYGLYALLFCAKGDGTPVPTEHTDHERNAPRGYLFDAAPGDVIACDWYNVPIVDEDPVELDASLLIRTTRCPVDYAGDDFAEDCTEPRAGVSFSVGRVGTDVGVGDETDSRGIVFLPLFTEAGPGTFRVGETFNPKEDPYPPAPIEPFVVDCAHDESGEPIATDTWEGGFLVEAAPGDRIFCHWYSIPAGDEPTPDPGVRACTADDLTAAAGWQRGAGTIVGAVRLTNRSATACALQGQPQLMLADAQDRILQTTQTDDCPDGCPAEAVILQPGGRALVSFVWSNWCAEAPDAPFRAIVTLPGGWVSATVLGPGGEPASGFPRCIDQNAASILAVGPYTADGGPTDDGSGGTGRTGDDRSDQGRPNQGSQPVTTLPKTGTGPANQGGSPATTMLILCLVAGGAAGLAALRRRAS